VAVALKERAKTLVEMAEMAVCYFADPATMEIDPEARAKFLTPQALPILIKLRQAIAQAPSLDQAGLESAFKDILAQEKIKMNQLAQPLRVVLTGKTYSPGIYDVLVLMGKEKTLAHMDRAIQEIQQALSCNP
jgi:glutamyl-tRNA synthetase